MEELSELLEERDIIVLEGCFGKKRCLVDTRREKGRGNSVDFISIAAENEQ
jgi:hypothetical protein